MLQNFLVPPRRVRTAHDRQTQTVCGFSCRSCCCCYCRFFLPLKPKRHLRLSKQPGQCLWATNMARTWPRTWATNMPLGYEQRLLRRLSRTSRNGTWQLSWKTRMCGLAWLLPLSPFSIAGGEGGPCTLRLSAHWIPGSLPKPRRGSGLTGSGLDGGLGMEAFGSETSCLSKKLGPRLAPKSDPGGGPKATRERHQKRPSGGRQKRPGGGKTRAQNGLI